MYKARVPQIRFLKFTLHQKYIDILEAKEKRQGRAARIFHPGMMQNTCLALSGVRTDMRVGQLCSDRRCHETSCGTAVAEYYGLSNLAHICKRFTLLGKQCIPTIVSTVLI